MTAPREPGHERWDELAAGHALDALEPAEEAELQSHLDSCVSCRNALREHEYVAAQLAALADDADLTPPSWGSIRAGIVGSPPVEQLEPVRPLRALRPAGRRPFLLAAAASVALIVAGVVAAVTMSRGPSGREAAISACRTQTSCHVVELRHGSSERAVVLVRDGNMQLLPTDLTAPGTDHVYALWQLPRDGKPTLVGQPVPTNRDMSASLVLPYGDTAAFALSIEPAGPPATAPTTVVAVGTAVT